MINELMNSSNNLMNIQFMKYISACFDLRDKLIPKTQLPYDLILILLIKIAFAILYRYLYGHAINKARCSS